MTQQHLAGLNHAGVVVADLAVSKAFYTDVLGLSPAQEFQIEDEQLSRGLGVPGARLDVIFWAVPGTATTIEMVRYLAPGDAAIAPGRAAAAGGAEPPAFRPGYGHIAFTVADIDAAHAELARRGARFISGPVTVPGGIRFCFLRDPDGNIVEIIQPA